jgi:hypothetical protein
MITKKRPLVDQRVTIDSEENTPRWRLDFHQGTIYLHNKPSDQTFEFTDADAVLVANHIDFLSDDNEPLDAIFQRIWNLAEASIR